MAKSITSEDIVTAAMIGERSRGSGGVVVIDRKKNHIGYVLIDELQPESLRDKIQDLFEDEKNNYIVVEEIERNVNVFKLSKTLLLK